MTPDGNDIQQVWFRYSILSLNLRSGQLLFKLRAWIFLERCWSPRCWLGLFRHLYWETMEDFKLVPGDQGRAQRDIRLPSNRRCTNLVADLLPKGRNFGNNHGLHALGRFFGFKAKVECLSGK
jgi:hypothetical protein